MELRLRWLEVERHLIVCTGWAEGLRSCQFPGHWRGGKKGRAIWDGGGGGCSRHNVVIGVNRREVRCNGKVWLLLLRLRLFLLAAIILIETEGQKWEMGKDEKSGDERRKKKKYQMMSNVHEKELSQ